MPAAQTVELSSWTVVRRWWSESAAARGQFATASDFLQRTWEFLRDSTPERKRRRYGDVDYDWEHRVETSSATVHCRDRWRGIFLSPYQATDAPAFAAMMSALRLPFEEFTFIDLGSGKGRTLLMASNYPFRRIIGVEILPELHRVAQGNVDKYRSEQQRCHCIEPICGDATDFSFPLEPIVLYLFNPVSAPGLKRIIGNLERSLEAQDRPVYVLYHNPLLEDVLAESSHLRRLKHSEQYSVWTNQEDLGNGI